MTTKKDELRKMGKLKASMQLVSDSAAQFTKALAYEATNHIMIPVMSMQVRVANAQRIKAFASIPWKHFKSDGSGKLDSRRVKKLSGNSYVVSQTPLREKQITNITMSLSNTLPDVHIKPENDKGVNDNE